MTDPAPNPSRKSPASPRRWIVWIWSFVLACGLAGLDTAHRALDDRAAEASLILLPREDSGDAGRKTTLEEIRKAAPGLRSAQWLSPRELAQQTSRGLSSSALGELFSGEDAWLPWIAEIRFADPIGDRARIQAWLETLKADRNWRLILWDAPAIIRMSGERQTLDFTASAALFLVFILGLAAIRLSPPRASGAWAEAGFGLGGVLILVLLFGVVATAAGVPLDERSWGVAIAASFALAGLIAPMLKVRRSFDHHPSTQPAERPHG